MAVLPVIIDSQPDYLRTRSASQSLLQVPLGPGTVLSHLASRVASIDAERLSILPPPRMDPDYERVIEAASNGQAKVREPHELADLLTGCEPADLLLLLDPRYWPVEGFDLAGIIRHCNGSPWVLHAVASQSSLDGTREFVRCDKRGYVRCVRRYYDRVTWPQAGDIPFSLVPIASAEDLSFHSLADLRSTLTDRGMLSRDVPLCSGIADLGCERALLALGERMVIDTFAGSVPYGYSPAGKDVLVGQDCQIDPSALLVGPVIIQEGARIESGVTIIGPAVIGSGAVLQRGAQVLQCSVTAGATVASGVTARHRIVAGDCRESPAPTSDPDAGPIAVSPFVSQERGDLSSAERSSIWSSRSRRWYQRIKLAIDISVAAAGLIVLSPMLILVAILIKLDSPGPILFGHEREGKDGNIFKCLKFRTMMADAHQKQREMYQANAVDGPQFKLDSDPRITRVGAWLRSINVDELPQLINVLRGEMSLVGPRPSPFRENQICVPWRRARLSVRPGITGLWQVCRHDRSGGDFHQWIAYDIRYVTNASLLVDFKLVLATIVTLGGQWSLPEHWIIDVDSTFGTLPAIS